MVERSPASQRLQSLHGTQGGSLLTSQFALGKTIDDFDSGKTEKLERPGGRWSITTDALSIGAGAAYIVGLALLAWFATQNM
jgi:hypothetical protein